MFGTSTANIKIESTWMRMISSQTAPWIVSYSPTASWLDVLLRYIKNYFHFLQTNGYYSSDALEDRVIFLYVFMPILRLEINSYADAWNAHQIRPQLARANHIAGIPNDLYSRLRQDGRRYGWKPDSRLLLQLEEAVSCFGKPQSFN